MQLVSTNTCIEIYIYIPHSVHLQTLSKYFNFLFSTLCLHYFVFQPFIPIQSYVYGWAPLAGPRSLRSPSLLNLVTHNDMRLCSTLFCSVAVFFFLIQ